MGDKMRVLRCVDCASCFSTVCVCASGDSTRIPAPNTVAWELRCSRTDAFVLMGATGFSCLFRPGLDGEIAAIRRVDIFVHMFGVGRVVRSSTHLRCRVVVPCLAMILSVRRCFELGSLVAPNDRCV